MLDPKVRDIIELLDADGALKLADLSPAEARDQAAEQASEQGDETSCQSLLITAPGRKIPMHIYRPVEASEPLPTLLYLHGGGWVVGELGICGTRAQALANNARCLVAVVDYRLAPEDRFPAAVDDVHRAAEWLGEHSTMLGGDPERLALLGDSAGGNLAAAAALKDRDSGIARISCQVLTCPVIDFEFSSGSMDTNAEGFLMERDDLRWCWSHYLADHADGFSPYASPARASSLAGLPPTLVITAEFDPLRDQAEDFGMRLEREGVDLHASRYLGVIHGFADYPELDQSAQAMEETVAFLNEAWKAGCTLRRSHHQDLD